MDDRKQILKIRISVLFVKEKFTFFNTIQEYKTKLRQLFTTDYCLDEIETALNELEEQLINVPETVIEIPEDFELK